MEENSSIVSITITTGVAAQLPISVTHQHQYPTLADQFVALFGSQNLQESTTQKTGQLIIPIGENEEEHLTSDRQILPESTETRVEISNFISSDVLTTQTVGQLFIPIAEKEELPTTEVESSNSSQDDQPVMTTLSNSDHDSRIPTERSGTIAVSIGENEVEEPLTTGLHDYSNPKIAASFAGVYQIFIAPVTLKYMDKKDSPFDAHIPFMIVSIVVYLMAILDLAILFCLYDRLKRPSHQHFSPGHYKILTCVFYILLILAILSVVPVLFTPQR